MNTENTAALTGLMVLPRGRHPKISSDRRAYLSGEQGHLSFQNDQNFASALLKEGDHFQKGRLFLDEISWSDPDALETLLVYAQEEYLKNPSKFPLYLCVNKESLDLIRMADHAGFTPYFGEWKESSEEQSQALWSELTDLLRNAG